MSGFNTVRLHWSKTGICSVLTLGASLGLIIFTVLVRKSEKQWKVLRDCLKNLPTGVPSGHQTFPRECAPREGLMTLANSLGQIFPDNPYRLSTVCTIVVFSVCHLWLNENWVNLSKRGGKDGVLRGISRGRSPMEIPRSSPASPRKAPSFPTLLLRFTFYFL